MQQDIRKKFDVDKNTPLSCVDLFCGLGGLTHGLFKRGITVTKGIDLDPDCRHPYEANNGAQFIQQDISELTTSDLAEMFSKGSIRVLAGCAPCQPFSTYSQKGRSVRVDSKWNLLLQFGRLARELQPEIVTMENVPQLLDHPVFEDFLSALEGYSIWRGIVDCDKYGIPQTRKRLVLLASKLGEIRLLTPKEFGCAPTTVRDVISHLPQIEAGKSVCEDPLHISPKLSELNMRRIRASKAGGTWRDWDKALLAPCHKRLSGQTYPSVYGRMDWDKPAPTITTQCFGFGNGRFGHPEQDRAISLREAAILQTFPDDYEFVPPGKRTRFNTIGRLIGNAVPVRLGELVADSIQKHIASLGGSELK